MTHFWPPRGCCSLMTTQPALPGISHELSPLPVLQHARGCACPCPWTPFPLSVPVLGGAGAQAFCQVETMLFMIHLLRNLLKWFSLFISFLIASLAAIGIAWPYCQGFLSTPASSGSRMAAKSFPLSGYPLWDSQASIAQGLLLGPVPHIPRSKDSS